MMLAKRKVIFRATLGTIVALCLGVAGWTQTGKLSVQQQPRKPSISPATATSRQEAQRHWYWVQQSLERMKTIKVGMTREQLMTVFTYPDGAHVVPPEYFEYRECPWFQVEVEFKAVSKPVRDSDGQMRVHNDPKDIIIKISRPYVAETWFGLVPDAPKEGKN